MDKQKIFNQSLTTPVKTEKYGFLKPNDGIIAVGSCFAEAISDYLGDRFIPVSRFPFGTVYNPLSIGRLLSRIIDKEYLEPEDCLETGGGWNSLLCHSSCGKTSQNNFLNSINSGIQQTAEKLETAGFLLITLGTSWIYTDSATNKIVNNCHKLPSANFERRPASIEEMVHAMISVIDRIQKINPEIRIILTISPVRHLRDSSQENSLSKARLRCLIDELCSQSPETIYYFPSYEIMMDELRDYRWYADDLIHPSAKAISYIMERFSECFGDNFFQDYIKEAEKIKRLAGHKIINPSSTEAASFITQRKQKIHQFKTHYPFVQLESRGEI